MNPEHEKEPRKTNTVSDAQAVSTLRVPPPQKIQGSKVPIIRSFVVLRAEAFGGYVFNPYLPPERKLDHIRFRIASLCDGTRTVDEIKSAVAHDLQHSKEYVGLVVESALKKLAEQYAVFWREQKLSNAKDFDLTKKALKADGSETLSAPLFVIWEITSACNLRCEHCLSDAGKQAQNELSTQEAKQLIDVLAGMKVFNINFSGGEPLIRPDIFEILEYVSEKNIGVDLLTNGGLISEPVLDRLENTNIFNVQVSVDGIEGTHDCFRGRTGSYKQALNAINLLLKKGYNVGINSVVTSQNINEIPRIIDKAVELGVKMYKTTLFMPTGRGKSNIQSLRLTPEDVKQFTLMIIEKKKEVGNKINITTETEYPWLSEPNCGEGCSTFEDEKASKVGCTAGTNSLYVTSDGKIAPCPFLRQIVAGDVRKDSIPSIWEKSPTFDVFRNIKRSDLKGRCSSCEYLGLSCFGGCRAAALALSGDLYAEDPTCWKHLA